MIKVVDTSALLHGYREYDENTYIPYVVLEELDKHKTFGQPDIKYAARDVIRQLQEQDVVKYAQHSIGNDFHYECNDDKILSCATNVKNDNPDEDVAIITDDFNLYVKAKSYGLLAQLYMPKEKEVYKGYREITMQNEEMSKFYSDMTVDLGFNLNEYLIIKDTDGNVVDKLKWDGTQFKNLFYRKIKSRYLPDISPMENDPVQQFAFDQLYSKDITVLHGKAGQGKTLMSLAFAMQQLDNNKVKKVYVVYSFEPLKNQRTLGFLPGDKMEKIFGSGLGTILQTKLGGLHILRSLIDQNKVEIVPTSDLRGVEFGEDDLVYMTEAQNTDAYTMRTLIQRCKMGCKIIIEGDMLEQVDIRQETNGMEKLVDAFKDTEYFSCVKLKNNYRNPISVIAEKIM